MKCGVRFCGGCNPRYDRGKALKTLQSKLKDEAELVIAEEEQRYDALVVIGGCTNCCASYDQFETLNEAIKMWDLEQIDEVAEGIKNCSITK